MGGYCGEGETEVGGDRLLVWIILVRATVLAAEC